MYANQQQVQLFAELSFANYMWDGRSKKCDFHIDKN